MTPSFADQAAAIRHIRSIAKRSGEANERVLEHAGAAIRTLDWFGQHPDVVKALARIFDAFPGLEIVEVRDNGKSD